MLYQSWFRPGILIFVDCRVQWMSNLVNEEKVTLEFIAKKLRF